jgi:dihydropteroate synthase
VHIGRREFSFGERTFVMGIINVTPDSFSGDGVLSVAAAVAQAQQMVADGADMLDVGGESTRPGHAQVDEPTELSRVVPVIKEVRAALPDIPISIDTTKPAVAQEALDSGADFINDIWGTAPADDLPRLAAQRRVPYVVMHNRPEPAYENVVVEVVADLERALDRAVGLGVDFELLIVDPGIGFGKTAEQNLAVLRDLSALRVLNRPIVLGTSRKSTIGKVLGGIPADQRLDGTLATTALGIAGGADIVRVHDVAANVRAARVADAIVRGTWREDPAR